MGSKLGNTTDSETAQQYRLLFEASPAPMFVVDAENDRILAVNDAALRQYGWSRGEFLALSFPALLPAAERGAARQSIERACQAGGDCLGTLPQLCKDGRVWDAEILSAPVRFDDRPARLCTVRKRPPAEAPTPEGCRLLQSLIGQVPAALAVLDRDLRYLAASQRWKDDYGLGQRDLVGRSHYEVFPEITETWKEIHRRCLAGETISSELDRFGRRDGSVQWLRWTVCPWHAADGRIGGIAMYSEDITEQVQNETALRKSETHLRALLETLPDLVWLKDPQGVYLMCNHRFEQFFGATEAEIVGKTDYDFVERELADFFREADQVAVAAGGPSVNEEEVVFADDGHREQLETVKTPLYGPEGELIGVLGIARDITQRKKLEAELQENLAVYQAAINTTALGFWVIDPKDARFLEVNDAYVRQSGYSREELLTLSIPDIEAKEKPEETAAHIEAIIQTGYARFETLHRRKDGSIWPVEVITSYSPIQGGRFFVFTEDITERKRTEEAIRRLNEDLEARVFQRTTELFIAKEEAEQASKAKSEFLSSMSHELRTPLNAILGFAQLMQMEDGASQFQQQSLDEILLAGRHLLALINQVLELAKIESGHLDLSIETVECRQLLEDSLVLVRPLAQQQQVDLKLVPDGLPAGLYVRADRMRLRQALLNLTSNAIKYNRSGGEVEIGLEAAAGNRLRFLVRDSGIGISPERQAELFQPFNRLDAQNSAIEGTGIGLVICKKLIEAMAGEIGFESRVGEGSTFWIDLPWVEMMAAPLPESATHAGRHPAPQAAAQVIYIEDNPASLRLMQQVFAQRPLFHLSTAPNAELGLGLISDQPPDLILLDINLTGMNGFEVLARLREQEATRAIPVVAISANAMSRDLERGRAAGFTDYLTKPLDIDRLLGVLDRLLAPGKANQQPRSRS